MRHPFAGRPVLAVAAALLVLLVATAQGYGWHRDELYFRMLTPSWGYVDQPPLVPFLARTLAGLVDQPWLVRLPAAACAAVSLVVLAMAARELGGGRRAQVLAAVAVAGGTTQARCSPCWWPPGVLNTAVSASVALPMLPLGLGGRTRYPA